MTCIHNDFEGKCELWDDTSVQFDHIVDSCDENGFCLVDDDESAMDSCEDYQEV